MVRWKIFGPVDNLVSGAPIPIYEQHLSAFFIFHADLYDDKNSYYVLAFWYGPLNAVNRVQNTVIPVALALVRNIICRRPWICAWRVHID